MYLARTTEIPDPRRLREFFDMLVMSRMKLGHPRSAEAAWWYAGKDQSFIDVLEHAIAICTKCWKRNIGDTAVIDD